MVQAKTLPNLLGPKNDGVAVDTANNRALIAVTDGEVGPIVAVDVVSGEQTELSLFEDGGVNFSAPKDVILDADGQRLLILESSKQAILALDFKTQERVVVSWTDINQFF